MPVSAAAVRERVRAGDMTIFDLLTAYHRSLENMRLWLETAQLDDLDRIGIADAWQSEMDAFFRTHGHCFACNRGLARCRCSG